MTPRDEERLLAWWRDGVWPNLSREIARGNPQAQVLGAYAFTTLIGHHLGAEGRDHGRRYSADVRITAETDWRGVGYLRVEVYCPALDRRPWYLMQPVEDSRYGREYEYVRHEESDAALRSYVFQFMTSPLVPSFVCQGCLETVIHTDRHTVEGRELCGPCRSHHAAVDVFLRILYAVARAHDQALKNAVTNLVHAMLSAGHVLWETMDPAEKRYLLCERWDPVPDAPSPPTTDFDLRISQLEDAPPPTYDHAAVANCPPDNPTPPSVPWALMLEMS